METKGIEKLTDIVPATDIYLDSSNEFFEKDPIFTSNNTSFLMVENKQEMEKAVGSENFLPNIIGGFLDSQRNIVIYRGDANKTFSNPFSLLWEDVGYDKDGKRIDLRLSCIEAAIELPSYFPQYDYGWTQLIGQIRDQPSPILGQANSLYRVSLSFEIEFLDTASKLPIEGGQYFMMGVDDLDLPATNPDYSYDWNSRYAEQFELISDFHPSVYMRNDNILNKQNNNTLFLPTAVNDENNYIAGLVCGLGNKARFRWSSEGRAGTFLLAGFEAHTITASREGNGSITYEGEKSIGWRNDRTYTATADKYHHISKITVDGVDIPVTNTAEQSYTFEDVRENHEIHVVFQRNQHSVAYEPNCEDAGGDMPPTEGYAGSNVEILDNGFARDGYAFVGWNTASDGTGDAYAPGDEIFLDDAGVILYAQWKKLVSVTFIDSDGTVLKFDGEVMLGGDSTPPELSKRTGYMFTGWLGTYQGVEKDETVTATWKPIEYTIVYDPNGGEGVDGQPMPEQEMTYDEEDTILENEYTRTNYEFIGWNTTPDGTGASYAPGNTVMNLASEQDAEIVLYAQWKFYIQMPETGEFGAFFATSIGLLLVGLAIFLLGMRRRGGQ